MSQVNRNWLRKCLPNVAVQCLNNSAVCVISNSKKVVPVKSSCDKWDKDVCKEEVHVSNWDKDDCHPNWDKNECWIEDKHCVSDDDCDDWDKDVCKCEH